MPIGRSLIILGAVLLAAGIILSLTDKLPGRLPGDIVIRGKNSVFYFPLATSLLLSVLLTLGMWLFNRR
ncbi:MAG: DUF2905 domain-containing protein [Bryobacteraceae bacterium]